MLKLLRCIRYHIMALSTAVGSEEIESGASGYQNYYSVLQDLIMSRISSLLATEIGLEYNTRSMSGFYEDDHSVSPGRNYVNVLDDPPSFDRRNYISVLHDKILTRASSLSVGKELGLFTEAGETVKDAAAATKSRSTEDERKGGEGEQNRGTLPEDVLEKIMARLPFRSLFQVRLLAGRWSSLIFSSESSETIFQMEVMANSLSSAWDSYCPIYVGMKNLFGYNSVSQVWERLLNLSYLPMSEAEFRSLSLGNVAGSLLSFFSTNQFANNKLHVWVTNPLNRTWRVLNPFSLTGTSKIVLVHMECVDASAYKLVVVTVDHIRVEGSDSEMFLGAQVYHSSKRCWTRYDPCTKRTDWMNVVSKWRSALVNEALYIMGQIIFCEPVLLSYNIKHEVWSKVTIVSPERRNRFWSEAMLFACGFKTMIVNVRRDSGRTATICELDLETNTTNPCGEGELVVNSSSTSWSCNEMATLQLPVLFSGPFMKIASDSSALYFFVPREGPNYGEELEVKVFDVHEKTWSILPPSRMYPIRKAVRFPESYKLATCAFQPGVNPFVHT